MRIRLSFLLCLLFSGIAFGISHAYGDERPDIRVIHAVPDAGIVDVYLGDIFAGTLDYGQSAPYIIVPQGNVTLRAFTSGADPNGVPLFEQEFAARNNQVFNAVLMGAADNMSLGIYETDRSPLAFGETRVNVIHAVADTPTATIAQTVSDVTNSAALLNFGDNVQETITAGQRTLRLEETNSEWDFNFNAGTSYTVVLIKGADDAQPVDARVFSSGTVLDEPSGYLRVVQTVFESSAFDLYLNDTLVTPALAYQNATVYIALPPGDYAAAFYAADPATSEPVLETVITITEGDWQTGVLLGSVTAPTLTLYSDDLSAVPEGQARLSLFNASSDNVSLSVDADTTLEAAPGELSEFTLIETGEQMFMLTARESVSETFINVSPNTAFNLRTIIMTNDGPIILSACALP